MVRPPSVFSLDERRGRTTHLRAKQDPSAYCRSPEQSIREAINCLEKNGKGIVLVTDETRRLIGTITDGDIRRAVLAGVDLGTCLQVLIDRKRNNADCPYPTPI